MKPSQKSPLAWLAAFGTASAAGLLAAVLWAPESGRHNRQRLAARLRSWSRAITGGHAGHHAPLAQAVWARPLASRQARGANLALDPSHLLAER